MTTPQVAVVVVAAGSGTRFGGPKQLEILGDERVVDRSVRVAAADGRSVVVVVPAGREDLAAEFVARGHDAVTGEATRSGSVRAGLAAVGAGVEIIVVHDAARPLATEALFCAVTDAVVAGADGAIPVIPVTDTIRHVDGHAVDRATLRAVQTPQAFRADMLRAAHAAGGEATDDASLVESVGGVVVVVDGETRNIKITTPDDLAVVRTMASS
ncbi:MAG: IspD/TarI family cytidylyltransferase [Acidimicrobiales bacterium]